MSTGCLTKIVSGAQTGADRGGMDAALELGLPIGGWAPQGWRSEDGCIPLVYRQYMRQSISPEYKLRTRLNVQDSDGTLLLSFADKLTGGSKFTGDQLKQQRKPAKHLVLPRGRGVVSGEVTSALWDWIETHKIAVLNIAGPRESKEPGLQLAVQRVVGDLLRAKRDAVTVATLGVEDARADEYVAEMRRHLPADLADRVSFREEAPALFDMRSKRPMPELPRADELLLRTFVDMDKVERARAAKPAVEALPNAGDDVPTMLGISDATVDALLEQRAAQIFTALGGMDADERARVMETGVISMPCSDCGAKGECGCAAKYVAAYAGRFTATPETCSCAREEGDSEYHAKWCPQSPLVQEFLDDCSRADAAEDFGDRNLGLIGRYYEMPGNGVGGSLHVVLDDHNHDRSSVEFCLNYAIKDGDKAGEALARALLALPDDVYAKVLPGPTYCGTCCQDYDANGGCKCPEAPHKEADPLPQWIAEADAAIKAGSFDCDSIAALRGKTLRAVTQQGNDAITFEAETGERWEMSHQQDCCEQVQIEDVVGDLQDLVGSPIVMAEAGTNSDRPRGTEADESFTWTFYKLATVKGYVTIRWYGSSNGYYGETADFRLVGGE